MRSMLVEAGGTPAAARLGGGRVLRFDHRRSDPRGWRLTQLVARHRRVAVDALLSGSRREAPIALARQIAMYLMHVGYGRTYAEVGQFFGRDRTTVSHACAMIEELREGPGFDNELSQLEHQLYAESGSEREVARAAGW
jgi:hypothetical protein